MSWRLRLVYAAGQLPEGVKSAAFGFFLLFYYNQVLGLSGTLAGIAVFIAPKRPDRRLRRLLPHR